MKSRLPILSEPISIISPAAIRANCARDKERRRRRPDRTSGRLPRRASRWRENRCKRGLDIFLRCVLIYICATILVPLLSKAQQQKNSIVINEIAWMGTNATANDEWIELYNSSNASIDLSGWELTSDDGSPKISLKGAIPSGGYFLLERTDDSTISNIPANQIYSGALENGGEILKLTNPQGVIIDQISHWYAGINKTNNRVSMERISPQGDGDDSNNWQSNNKNQINDLDKSGNTIFGTPKNKNSALAASSPQPTTSNNANAGASISTPNPTNSDISVNNQNSNENSEKTLIISFVEIKPSFHNDPYDWIKLFNNSDSPINIANWKIESLESQIKIIENTDIPAFGYKTIDFPPNSISPTSDLIVLKDAENDLIAKIRYGGYSGDEAVFQKQENGEWLWIKMAEQKISPKKSGKNTLIQNKPAPEAKNNLAALSEPIENTAGTSTNASSDIKKQIDSGNNSAKKLLFILAALGIFSSFVFIKIWRKTSKLKNSAS